MDTLTKRINVVLVAFLVIVCFNSRAQNNIPAPDSAMLKQTLTKFEVYNTNHPIEKIYLQLNKPWYNLNDTIWFKAYTVIGPAHKPTALSGVAYAELIGPNDSLVQRLNLKLTSGLAHAEFILPPTLKPGSYRIRAYTNWMKNYGEQYFYDQQIVIGGIGSVPAPAAPVAKKPPITVAAKPALPDVQFFPESGNLVTGLRSRVAFKAVNPNGSAASVTGIVTTADGEEVAAIQSGHDGMGLFALTPVEGKSYKANLKFANGSAQTVALPQPITLGFVLSVNNREKDTLAVKIALSPAMLSNKPRSGFYLIAQSGGQICFTTTGKLDAPLYLVKVPKNRFPAGVARITLFSSDGEPLNERVVYIQRPDNLKLNIIAAKTTYSVAEKINLAINSVTAANQPTEGSFSATVINESLAPADEKIEPNIFGQLLLNSELHGKINDAGYYFADENEGTLNDLDMLMLTQGFRKLEWKRITDSAQQLPHFLAEDGLTLSGLLTAGKKPVVNGKLKLLSLKQLLSMDTVTNYAGRFTLTGLNITGQTPLSLKAVTAQNSTDVNITLDYPELKVNGPATYDGPVDSLPAPVVMAMKKSFSDNGGMFGAKQLQEVNIKDTHYNKPPPDLSTSTNLNGPGQANYVIMGSSLVDMGCPILSNCLAVKIPFVTLKNGNLYDVSRGRSAIIGAGPMTIFINGAIGSLDNISVDDIYSIEVLTSVAYKAIYGHDAAGGLILITTKRGIEKNEKIANRPSPGSLNFMFTGYYKARTFYTPKYDTPEAIAKQEQRTAVYWKPDIITDKDGKATIDYNNAGKGNYRVVIEGIDNDGHLGRQVFRYKVE